MLPLLASPTEPVNWFILIFAVVVLGAVAASGCASRSALRSVLGRDLSPFERRTVAALLVVAFYALGFIVVQVLGFFQQ